MDAKRWLFVILAAGLAVLAHDGPLQPEDVARIHKVKDAYVAPDGRAIAYTLEEQRLLFKEENGKAWVKLFVWDKQNGSRPYVSGKVRVDKLSWSADGNEIYYLAKRGDDPHITLYGIPLHGGESRPILRHDTDIDAYSWQADGRRLVFLANEKADDRDEKLREQGFDQEVYEEDLVFPRVWVADFRDGAVEKRAFPLDGAPFDIALSPNGKWLMVTLAPKPLVDFKYMYRRIHIFELDTGTLVAELETEGKLDHMAWSPDSSHLAILAGADRHDPNSGRLFIATLPEGRIKKYFMEDKGDVRAMAWKNAEQLYYLWDESVFTDLRLLEIGSGKTGVLTVKDQAAFSKISVSHDGARVALVGDTPEHPAEVFHWQSGSDRAERLTETNPWLAHIRLARQELVTYKSRDGLSLDGLLIRPLDQQKGVKYPLILVVHGGPESHFRQGWITDYARLGQMAAARGFAVFYPNYRASTGRGVAFSQMDHGRPAMEEFDDLVDAVRHFVKIGEVDEKKVGVTGGSYGGYATAWCSTALSEHFAAGVMFVGISNKVSKLGTSDIPDEVYLVHDRHRLWENWQLFLEQSPIYHVEKARTPLLILHGKKDPRVPSSQSLELYRNLKILGRVPVRLVYYPDEQHGNSKAAARYDYSLRALRWFEHYLKGEGGEKPPFRLEISDQNE